MLTVTWGYFPPEVRRAFAPILARYVWLVPGWCQLLYVAYRTPDDPEWGASCEALPEYRQGRIYLHPGWLEGSPDFRRRALIHEVLHLPLAPMVAEHDVTVERLFDDGDAPKFKATLLEQWRQRYEGTVQDLALAISLFPDDVLPAVPFREVEDEHPPVEPQGIVRAA